MKLNLIRLIQENIPIITSVATENKWKVNKGAPSNVIYSRTITMPFTL